MGDYTTPILFTPHQEYVQRVLSVLASTLSITAGLAALYLYISMRVKVFRHHLILLLLLADFGKAVVLLWYPARVLGVPSAYNNINFCDVVGFFTSTFIEAADLAVLTLAIHTALLVFTRYSGPEGGLYPYRYYVYGVHVILPLIMAALAFITFGRRSYIPLVTWCYLPIRPYWARLVLSWVPRYLIIVSIISIYLSIYIYVKLEYRKVVKEFKESQTYLNNTQPHGFFHSSADSEFAGHDFTADILGSSDIEMQYPTSAAGNFDATNKPSTLNHTNPPTQSQFRRNCSKVSNIVVRSMLAFFSYFPGFSFLAPNRYIFRNFDDSQVDATTAAIRDFQRESMVNFQMRRNTIERQIRSIFVYPAAYIFLWMAPFAVHVLQFKYEVKHHGIFWISAAAAFMQPFNCVVDTVAFCIREKPWVDRDEKIFTKENKEYLQYQLSRAFPFVSCPSSYQAPNNHQNSRNGPGGGSDDSNSHDLNNKRGNSAMSRYSESSSVIISSVVDKRPVDYHNSHSGNPQYNPNKEQFGNMELDEDMVLAGGLKPPILKMVVDPNLATTDKDKRQTSTSSDHSHSTDATYTSVGQNLQVTHKIKINNSDPDASGPQFLSRSGNILVPPEIFGTSSTIATSPRSLHPRVQSASSLHSIDPEILVVQKCDSPLAPPVPSITAVRSNSFYRNRSSSPSRHAQRVVEKKVAQAAQRESRISSDMSERSISPTPFRNSLNIQTSRSLTASPLGTTVVFPSKNNVNAAAVEDSSFHPFSNALSNTNVITLRISSANASSTSIHRNVRFDEEAFHNTTAQRVEISKSSKNKRKKSIKIKESNPDTNSSNKQQQQNNEHEGDEDGPEMDLLEFLR